MLKLFTFLSGAWSSSFSVHLLAADSTASIDVSWQTLLIGYGPLGVFAVLVGIDKIGNNSERNRLRITDAQKDQHIADLHQKIENDIVPALVSNVTAQQEGAKALADAVDVITKLTAQLDEKPPRSRKPPK